MKLDVVENRKTFYIRLFALITLLIGVFAFLAEISIAYLLVPLVQFIPLFISPNYFYRKIGSLELNEDVFKIAASAPKSIPVRDVQSLKIFYNDPKFNEKTKKLIVKGFIISIMIEAQGDFLQEYKVLIKKNEREELRAVLEKYYLSKINLRERDNLGMKYFLLKGNLTYNEIQEVKNKYHISW